MTFEEWWHNFTMSDSYGDIPWKNEREIARAAWQVATERAAGIAEKFADDLKLKSPAYGTATLVAQKIRE